MSLTEWKITNGTFKDFRFHVAVPNASVNFGITSQEIGVERRLQITERALLDGADIEDFGRKARTFSAEVLFFGGDYQDRIKQFDALLNQGTTGELVLPDLDTAVHAKFQKYNRKTSSADGSTTVISVSWIEDRSAKAGVGTVIDSLRITDNSLDSQNTPQALGANVIAKATSLSDAVTNNPYVAKINAVKDQINSAAISINQQTASYKQLISTVVGIQGAFLQSIANVKAAVNGALSFLDTIKIIGQSSGSAAATSYTTDLSSDDFKQPDTVKVTTATLTTTQKAAVTSTTVPVYLSAGDSAKALSSLASDVATSRDQLEVTSNGKTKDVSSASVDLINAIIDFNASVLSNQNQAYLVTQDSSLIEVMFRNGIDLSRAQEIFKLNSTLPDVLYIQPLTVVYL